MYRSRRKLGRWQRLALNYTSRIANGFAGRIYGFALAADRRLKDAAWDDHYEADHAAIEAMIGGYKDQRFQSVPGDPRAINPEIVRSVRERLEDKYYYQWRATRANAEIVDALYAGCIQSNECRYTLCVQSIFLNDKGESPPPRWGPSSFDDEFQKFYYVSACSVTVRPFINSHDDAVSLLNSLLPGWGYCLRRDDNGTRVRLEKGGEAGPWKEGYPPLALVTAILERLEHHPDEAAPWRKI